MFNVRASAPVTAPFEMTGVSSDPDKPHKLTVRNISRISRAAMNQGLKDAGAPQATPRDEIDEWITVISKRAVVSWESVELDGAPVDATPALVAAYLNVLADSEEHAHLVMKLATYVSDEKNFPVVADGASLGKG